LEDSKAEDIVSIDIQKKSSLGDHMVIASGRSNRHVAAVSDHLIKALKDAGLGNARVEGLPAADWVLVDAGDVIVHVFRPEIASSTTSKRCGRRRISRKKPSTKLQRKAGLCV
jgi:ribosome-associated protein